MSSRMPWIDWQAAVATATALMPAGPSASQRERIDCVQDLRRAAALAPELIAEAARLPGRGESVPELVVDRPGIVAANVSTARTLMTRLGLDPGRPDGAAARLAGTARGRSVGAVLAVVCCRLLGQFDAFGPEQRLLLVAPNIMMVERQIGAVPRDFRTWVALHEQTHRVQFANAPWLLDWFGAKLSEVLDEDDEQGFWADLETRWATWRRDRARGRAWSVRLGNAASDPGTVVLLDEIAAVMSLLEGHADVMMDRGGPEVVPTLGAIRSSFDRRRDRTGPAAWLGRLIGMDAKLAQYRDGAAFCREVIGSCGDERRGIDLFNRVFESAAMLPSLDELLHPRRWIDRAGSSAGC